MPPPPSCAPCRERPRSSACQIESEVCPQPYDDDARWAASERLIFSTLLSLGGIFWVPKHSRPSRMNGISSKAGPFDMGKRGERDGGIYSPAKKGKDSKFE